MYNKKNHAIWVLHTVKGLPYSTISTMCNTTRGSVSGIVRRFSAKIISGEYKISDLPNLDLSEAGIKALHNYKPKPKPKPKKLTDKEIFNPEKPYTPTVLMYTQDHTCRYVVRDNNISSKIVWCNGYISPNDVEGRKVSKCTKHFDVPNVEIQVFNGKKRSSTNKRKYTY